MTKSELIYYKKTLEDLNGKREYNDYELLKKDLLVEFGIRITTDNIRSLLNDLLEIETLEEEEEDLRLIYNNAV